ncbi:RidA family protein [Paenibacillus kandeliae]|uniref:RidA family protein n=1 Tax=Paenibacillus kandeliae TaxID=3231269 RepID=UPI00345AE04C
MISSSSHGDRHTHLATDPPVLSSPVVPTTFHQPSTLPAVPGYTHVVEVRGGRTLYISGQVALNEQGQLIGKDNVIAQAEQVFRNIQLALQAVGATFEHVVKLTIFMTDITDLPRIRSIRDQYINAIQPPASSAVEVRRLVHEDWLLEIEAIAVCP